MESDTLQVCLFERGGRLTALGYALALFSGPLPRLWSYRLVEARGIEVRGRPGEPIQVDGDGIGRLNVAIEVLPKALDLVFPPSPSQPDRGRVGSWTAPTEHRHVAAWL